MPMISLLIQSYKNTGSNIFLVEYIQTLIDEGRIHIGPYHKKQWRSHGCPLCPPNMCKVIVIDSNENIDFITCYFILLDILVCLYFSWVGNGIRWNKGGNTRGIK